jgi:hypothetical protein
MQRTITPEYMCQGCDCRRTLTVMRSSPASSSRSSSFPKAPDGKRAGRFQEHLENARPVTPDERIGVPCIHTIFPLPGSVRGEGSEAEYAPGS